MKKILVTGSSGFLGSRIVEYYKNRYDILTPTHGELDITDEMEVSNYFELNKPDIVIHCAAISDVGVCERDPERAYLINVEGSVHIAKASKDIQAKCVICSSDQVYFGSHVEVAHKEEEELTPVNIYGKGKLEAEQMCLEVNPDCVLLRLSWMYDTRVSRQGEHGDFFTTLIPKLKTEETLSYPIYDRRGITDVNEVVENIEKALYIPGGVYNFGSPNEMDTYSTIQKMFFEAKLESVRLCENREAFADSPRNLSMDQEKINRYGIFFSVTLDGLVRNLLNVL